MQVAVNQEASCIKIKPEIVFIQELNDVKDKEPNRLMSCLTGLWNEKILNTQTCSFAMSFHTTSCLDKS